MFPFNGFSSFISNSRSSFLIRHSKTLQGKKFKYSQKEVTEKKEKKNRILMFET